MASITLTDLRKSFDGTEVIKGVDLEINDGEFCVLVGPSGCGKSTLLRLIAGLEDISSGSLQIGDTVMNEVAPKDRGVSMVFQSYALYPHMTVEENMSFGLGLSGVSKSDTKARVRDVADTLQLTDLLGRKPKQLSGGQRQRVAIGRAIVRDPDVFLFDEPLSNLDAALRVQMRLEIRRLHQRLSATIIHVTHDQIEAMTLADRIVVLNDGRVEQQGSPRELYDRPDNTFVAQFIGSPAMNLVDGQISGGELIVDCGDRPLKLGSVDASDQNVKVGVRPEHLAIQEIGQDGSDLIPLEVDMVEDLGDAKYIHGRWPGADGSSPFTFRVPGDQDAPSQGTTIQLMPAQDRLHVFDADGERLLSL